MHKLKQTLLDEQAFLTRLVQDLNAELSADLAALPPDHIRISHSNNTTQYYQVSKKSNGKNSSIGKNSCKNSGGKNGTYIPREEMELVYRLAQRDYDEELLRLAGKRLKQISRITRDYEDFELDQVYLSKKPERQALIKPYCIPWDRCISQWQNQEYPHKGFDDSTPIIYTDRGERVRSKSEKILADYFNRNNIPYLYEKPITLSRNITIFPDFTFLSREKRKEIYWEHLGRMDDPAYVNHAIRKISTYQANGIFPGDRLILTYETRDIYLSTGDIDLLCRKYLIE